MKGTYPIGAILRRFFRIGFSDTFQSPEVSDDAHRRSQEHYRKHQAVPPLKISPSQPDPNRDSYLAYQRELQAGRLVPDPFRPACPGTVIKLPLTELKPVSKRPADSDDVRHPVSPSEE